jgi:hypothetical protein
MKHAVAVLGMAVLGATAATVASAQIQHLKCYKIADPQEKAKYTADLTGIKPGPGCTIVIPAALVCEPIMEVNLSPAPPGSNGAATGKGFACYKVKCKNTKTPVPPVQLKDQFGDRDVTVKTAKLVCEPLVTGIGCGDSTFPQCGGICPSGQVCQAYELFTGTDLDCHCTASCRCVDPATACNGGPCPSNYCVREACTGGPIIIPFETCQLCGNAGDLCEDDADCCCGSCSDHPVGTAGICEGSLGDPGCPAVCQ